MKMEMPITRPSRMSYADEINFSELLRELSKEKHNGFIRITSGSEEGYILFKNGMIVAASFGRSSRSEAVESIISTVKDDVNTLIEIFDSRPSQVDYLLDLNKPFQLDSDYADLMGELEKFKKQEKKEIATPEDIPGSGDITTEEEVVGENIEEQADQNIEPLNAPGESQTEEISEEEMKEESSLIIEKEDIDTTAPFKEKETTSSALKEESEDKTAEDRAEEVEVKEELEVYEPTSSESESPAEVKETPVMDKVEEADLETSETETLPEVSEAPEKSSETEEVPKTSEKIIPEVPTENKGTVEMEEEPMDRSKLLEKYGIKDMDDSDVEDLLNSYKGGSVSDEDIEKIELTVMNRIKKIIMGIPKVKSAEVMVFLDNTKDLTGNVNIIVEYESSGFLSRIMGESRAIADLKKQITTLTQMEIKKTFRGYQEIVDKFEINIEIS